MFIWTQFAILGRPEFDLKSGPFKMVIFPTNFYDLVILILSRVPVRIQNHRKSPF